MSSKLNDPTTTYDVSHQKQTNNTGQQDFVGQTSYQEAQALWANKNKVSIKQVFNALDAGGSKSTRTPGPG